MENEENKELENEKKITNNNEDNKKANMLCILSIALAVVPMLIGPFFRSILPENSVILENISAILKIGFPAAFIIMIYVRCEYPKNSLGKVLMILYIIIPIIPVIFACLFLAMCFGAAPSCPG